MEVGCFHWVVSNGRPMAVNGGVKEDSRAAHTRRIRHHNTEHGYDGQITAPDLATILGQAAGDTSLDYRASARGLSETARWLPQLALVLRPHGRQEGRRAYRAEQNRQRQTGALAGEIVPKDALS
jgi:hypothetical protein